MDNDKRDADFDHTLFRSFPHGYALSYNHVVSYISYLISFYNHLLIACEEYFMPLTIEKKGFLLMLSQNYTYSFENNGLFVGHFVCMQLRKKHMKNSNI